MVSGSGNGGGKNSPRADRSGGAAKLDGAADPGGARTAADRDTRKPAVRVCVVTGYGINTDPELAYAFRQAGADSADRVHVSDLIAGPGTLDGYDILAFPGGFSFGDHLGSGLVLAGIVRKNLSSAITRFIRDGKPVIGVCNGFQVLVKSGLLPDIGGKGTPEASLIHNASGKFTDQWVSVSFDPESPCVWTRGLASMELPVRHGEGRFIAPEETLDLLEREHLAVIRYVGESPNGAERNIAGITDRTGLILGLMPHPEAAIFPHNLPRWQRGGAAGPFGTAILKNGVDRARERKGRETEYCR